MGMYLGIVALSDRNIARLLEDPPLVWQVVSPDDREPYESARDEEHRAGFLSKLLRKSKAREVVPDLELSSGEGATTDLDKAWHGIHYLLTGTAWEGEPPLNFLVSGGTEVGDLEVGIGPARVFTAAETRQVRDALMKLSDATLRARFNPADMLEKEIYPEIWDRKPEDDDTLGYLMEYLGTLRAFLNQTVDHGLGLVVDIS